MRDVLLHGDCLELLATLESNSVDALCCDPPAGISFMGMAFDSNRGGRQQWIAWLCSIMQECLRVVKPGGHALVWALPRTSHWTATALEDSGWEIRDVITHTFGSGFPKSHDISKAIDKLAGAEREVVARATSWNRPNSGNSLVRMNMSPGEYDLTAPATPDAQRWSGYGSALKPASEHWILARKPLAAANLASNVLAWGTGGLAIDKCRVNNPGPHGTAGNRKLTGFKADESGNFLGGMNSQKSPPNQGGRWPPNFLLSHSAACSPAGCADSCPVKQLDEQAGERKSGALIPSEERFQSETYGAGRTHGIGTWEANTGNVSRFFPVFDMPVAYFPKASRRERNAGCEALPPVKGKDYGNGKGLGHTIPHCPEYDASVVWGSNSYTCGCPIAYEQVKEVQGGMGANTHPT